jgi:hypothetical protein
MFGLFRKIFRGASAPATDPDEVLAGRQGNVPVYIGGTREAMERLRPIVIRSTRHRQPHPVEQGPRGIVADRDFQPPPAPPVTPKVARGIAVMDSPPSDHRPYAGMLEEQDWVERRSSTMWVEPYGLQGRDLS